MARCWGASLLPPPNYMPPTESPQLQVVAVVSGYALLPSMRFLVFLVVVLMVGCQQPRPPLSPGLAANCADSLLLNEHLAWGEASEILPPDGADPHGHRWWQVRYKSGPDGMPRLVLVEDQTRWARLPPSDWIPRVTVKTPSTDVAPQRLLAGPWILAVITPDSEAPEARAQRMVDANELNHLAAKTGVVPAFSVREARDGRVQLVYGWQGDGGMARDETVRDWLRLRTRWQASTWIDLTVR